MPGHQSIGNVCPANLVDDDEEPPFFGPHESSGAPIGVGSLEICLHCGGAYRDVKPIAPGSTTVVRSGYGWETER